MILCAPPQVQTIPLKLIANAGQAMSYLGGANFLPLARKGERQSTVVRFGAKAFPVTIVDARGVRTIAFGKEAFRMRRTDVQAPDGKNIAMYQARVSLPGQKTARYTAWTYVSDTKMPDFDRVRDRLTLIPEFGYLGTAWLGGRSLRIGIRGADPARAELAIDRDGDGRPGSLRQEVYRLSQPFSLGGTAYTLAAFDPTRPSVSFAVSPKKVAEVSLPPDLRVGKVAPALFGKTLAGKPVVYPKGWPGKIVLLDVWATWCGPCVAEIPFMRAAYAKHRPRGFEIVSFSIDDPGMRARVAAFAKAKGASWVQVYEGQGWAGPTPRRYNVTSIPFMLLVDGSTGKILATEENLRGTRLDTTVSRILGSRGR